jgi:hypothetical protein
LVQATGSSHWVKALVQELEDFMEAAIDRIMMTYDLLMNRSAAASAEARAKDMHRLAVCGLTYLRELDGSSDPVKAGYTGL